MSLYRKCRLPMAALLVLGTGCNLGFSDDPAATTEQNECSESAECGGGTCSSGMCRTQTTELGALLIYVTPASGTPVIAGVGFANIVEDLDFDRGPSGYEISLGHVSRITGAVRGGIISEENCVIDESLPLAIPNEDGSIAARLTLTPRERLLGLTNPSYTIEVSDQSQGAYTIYLNAPPGRYDVYVEPRTTAAGCVRPPYLAVDREIEPGDVSLAVNLPEPTALHVRVQYPGGATDLRGWTVELVERSSGRRLSNRAVLGEAVEIDGGFEYAAELSFSEVEGAGSSAASELVRLSPPKDVVGPEVYVERSVVELFQDGGGLIDQLTELPLPVTFSARVATEDAKVAVPANVLFLATSLESTGPGTVAAFSSSVETEETGLFEVKLLPGRYRAIVRPRDETLAPVETEITVNDAEVQAGRTIEVVRRQEVTGQVVDFRGSALSGVSVVMAAAEHRAVWSVLEMAQGRQTFPPDATSAVTRGDGHFSLLSDEGRFHMTGRLPSSSGYPWQVRLGERVGEEPLNLGRLRVSLPVVVSGMLTSQDIGDVVPEALITAYAMLKDGKPVADAQEADQVTPVAESRVDAEGRFRLLLPSTVE